MARRLASVAELYTRRAREYAEAGYLFTDVTVAVAAEISPIQNISHARAVEQVRTALTLHHRLPRIAKVFRSGLIDYPMVATLIARTKNVDGDIIADLDEALAGRVHRWMKFSGPKLRDRVDMWVANHDPAAGGYHPKPMRAAAW